MSSTMWALAQGELLFFLLFFPVYSETPTGLTIIPRSNSHKGREDVNYSESWRVDSYAE